MNRPQKCNPHFCAFDSPACPEQCKSTCKRVKPNCISVTAQEALNIPELKIPRTKTGIPIIGICTRERVFGIPYDPRKDFDVPLPQEDLDQYLRENFDSVQDASLKEYIKDHCCESECKCPMGSLCMCKTATTTCNKEHKDQQY